MRKRKRSRIFVFLFLLCFLAFAGPGGRIGRNTCVCRAASDEDTLLDDFGMSLGRRFVEGELFAFSYFDADAGLTPDDDSGSAENGEQDAGAGTDAGDTGTVGTESGTEESGTDGETGDTEGLTSGAAEQEASRDIVSVISAGDSYFERETAGSTGWSTTSLTLRAEASSSSASVGTLSAGTAFRIAAESGDWWQVTLSDGTTGYVEHSYCMINLPDVLPEMEYAITNSYYSIYVSSGYEIPGVTGTKLYSAGTAETEGKVWNERLGKYEYLVPVMYSAAKKISIAQYNAYNLTNGQFTLKIYDSYRPHSVTTKIASALTSLYNSNSTVQRNIDYSTEPSGATYSWGYSWFLAQSLSTHNTGSAIDVTLCEYNEDSGSWRELDMPTDVHELSSSAIKYYSGSVSKSPSNYSGMMNDNSKLLDYIFIGGSYNGYSFQSTGMDTLASEWWHFQDNDTHRRVRSYASSGCDFQVTECLSM